MHSLKLRLEIVEYYRGCVRPRRGCVDMEKRDRLNLIEWTSNQSMKNYEIMGVKFSRDWMAQKHPKKMDRRQGKIHEVNVNGR